MVGAHAHGGREALPLWRSRAKLDEGRVAVVGFAEAVEGLVVFVAFFCSCTIWEAEGPFGFYVALAEVSQRNICPAKVEL